MQEHFCDFCRKLRKYPGQTARRTGGIYEGWEFLPGAFAGMNESGVRLETLRCL